MKTWNRWDLRNDWLNVEVDALDVGVGGGDQAETGAVASADVDEHLDVIEAVVDGEQLLEYDGRVSPHGIVKSFAYL